MGNICQSCKDAKEKSKQSSVFQDHSDRSNSVLIDPTRGIVPSESTNKLPKSSSTNAVANAKEVILEAERQKVLEHEEQARLESIVLTANRDMVGFVNGNGLINGNFGSGGGRAMTYYDPVYAASISQDLISSQVNGGFNLDEQYQNIEDNSCKLTALVLGQNQIPKSCVENGVSAIEVLSERIDFTDCLRGIMRYDDLLSGGGSGARSGGGDEMEYFEDVAESFLASCTKEGLFQDAGPIVENLP